MKRNNFPGIQNHRNILTMLAVGFSPDHMHSNLLNHDIPEEALGLHLPLYIAIESELC